MPLPHADEKSRIDQVTAEAWTDFAAARAICARADSRQFHYGREVRAAGDVYCWGALTTAAERVERDLELVRETALIEELGYSFEGIDWKKVDAQKLAEAWLNRAAEIPSVSEAIEAEFARREGRWPREDRRPSATEAAEFRRLISDDIPYVSQKVIDVSTLPEFRLAQEHLRKMEGG